jgi:hypothetical protein
VLELLAVPALRDTSLLQRTLLAPPADKAAWREASGRLLVLAAAIEKLGMAAGFPLAAVAAAATAGLKVGGMGGLRDCSPPSPMSSMGVRAESAPGGPRRCRGRRRRGQQRRAAAARLCGVGGNGQRADLPFYLLFFLFIYIFCGGACRNRGALLRPNWGWARTTRPSPRRWRRRWASR